LASSRVGSGLGPLAARAGLGAPWPGLLALSLSACATDGAAGLEARRGAGVADLGRPPGMPIGTGASGGELDARAASTAAAEPGADVTDNSGLAIPRFATTEAASAARVPCAGCVELSMHVNDINQRDEFVLALDGAPITRVVWTVLVSFNSDQLAVQPFVDDDYGKYTELHVNSFPLGTPVEVVQEVQRKARTLGLVVGSSGAWTGNQTMSVFIDSVRVEGARGFTQSFSAGPAGLSPRTQARDPRVVFHPER
jgi:hypothetical protein